jgi:predicted enzyme related to lactoylglutathione lyase
VVMPRTSIGEHGFIARFVDTEGNAVAIHSM